jgi:Ala-tRNA(Pro) deacylase
MTSSDSPEPQTALFSFLESHAILEGKSYVLHEHPAVFTCEESLALNLNLPGADTKNLFLVERSGARRFLIAVPHNKKVQLSALATLLQVRKLDFGGEAELRSLLGVTPGAVTLLGLFCDTERRIEVVIDQQVWQAAQLQCHPMRNTATLVLEHAALEAFLKATGQRVQVLDVPQRA